MIHATTCNVKNSDEVVHQLFSIHSPFALYQARLFCGRYQDVPSDDARQEALQALVIAARTYRPQDGKFVSYAAPSIRQRLWNFRMCQMHWTGSPGRARRLNRQGAPKIQTYSMGTDREEDYDFPGRENDVVDAFITADLIRFLLAKLPAKTRQLVRDLFWRNRTRHDIARRDKVTTKAIDKRYKAAMAKLREALPASETQEPQARPRRVSDLSNEDIVAVVQQRPALGKEIAQRLRVSYGFSIRARLVAMVRCGILSHSKEGYGVATAEDDMYCLPGQPAEEGGAA